MRCLRLRMTWRSTRAGAGGKALRPYSPPGASLPVLFGPLPPANTPARKGSDAADTLDWRPVGSAVAYGAPMKLTNETNKKRASDARFCANQGALRRVIQAGAACHHRTSRDIAIATLSRVMESAVEQLSRSTYRFFNGPAVLLTLGYAAVVLRLSPVRCETDWTEFEPKECRASVSGGGRTPGLCVPLTWCPPLVALAGRGRRPKSCGFHDSTVLVCCPKPDVVNPTTPNTGTLSSRQPDEGGPRNEPGCGAVVDDPGAVINGPNGGVRLTRSAWPWVAAIFKGDKFLCGGSLLDGNTVLTAAHCFPDYRNDARVYKVRVGILEVNETASSHSASIPVASIRLHERYRTDRHYNDIALVKIASKAPYGSHIGPVCLPQPDLKLGGQVVVLGWGHTAFGGRYAHRLQEGRVSVISNEECDEIMRTSSSYWVATPDGITEDFVCAVNHTGVDACQGDSGGPLLALDLNFRWNIVGVVSFGIGCGGRFPGAYTRVTTFLDWIARNRD